MLERFFTPYHTETAVQGERIAILAPHPDDEVFGCGASACKWADQGRTVQAFIISAGVVRGEFGDQPEPEQKRQAKAEQRAKESRAAAAVLGLPEPRFLKRQDGELLDDAELDACLIEQLQEWQPTTLVVPSIWEMHPDHRAVAELGLRLAQKLDSVAQLTFYEVGVPLQVNVLEDITHVEDRKWHAMQCFSSQLAAQHYADQIKGLNTFRAYTLGLDVTSAEAFHCLPKAALAAFMQHTSADSATLALQNAQQAQAHQQSIITEQQQRIECLEQLLHQTKQTLSWKITRPLRWCRRLFK